MPFVFCSLRYTSFNVILIDKSMEFIKKDTMAQVVEISIQFQYKAGSLSREPFMMINSSKRYEYGDRIDGIYGLTNTTLDERFWKYLCFLALRRYYGINDGWVTARELNQLFDSHISPEGSAARKYFERRLRHYRIRGDPSNSHLIEYLREPFPAGDTIKGISIGPYRLSIGPPHLKINPADCWHYILGPERIINITPKIWNPEILDYVESLFSSGRFVETRILLQNTIAHLLIEKKGKNLQLIADLWQKLANTEMILGQSHSSIQAADSAIQIYRKIGRNNYNIAECLHIKANAYGQLGMHIETVGTLNFAQHWLVGKVSSGIEKADLLSHILANKGKIISLGGNAFLGGKILEKAKNKAMSGHSIGSLVTMDLRLVQHLSRNNEFSKAETLLANVQGYKKKLSTSEYALFLRSASSYFLRTEQWDNARAWCQKSLEHGQKHGMQNHTQQIQDMIAKLRERGQWDD